MPDQATSTPSVITLDLGTTHIKAFVYTSGGEELFAETEDTPYNVEHHQDAAAVLAVTLEVLGKICVKLNAGGLRALAISMSGAMHSILPVTADIQPLDSALLWSDNQGASIAAGLRDTLTGRQIFAETGTPLHPMSVLIKLAWMQTSRVELFSKAAYFISLKEFVYFKLTGCRNIDHSLCSSTGMFDPRKLAWSPQALEFAGLTPHRLFTPVSVYHQENLLATLCRLWNLQPNFPVVIGASDGCLATLGAAPLKEGNISISMGTSAALRSVIPSFKTELHGRLFTYLLDETHFVIGGPSNNAGAVFTWFVSLFTNTIPCTSDFEEILTAASTISPGADGLLFEPFLFGERAPYWDATLTAGFKNLKPGHTRGHLARAVIEGLLYNLKTIVNLLQSTVSISAIFAGGGLLKFPLFQQLLADIFNREIVINADKEDSSAGAAIIGFKSLGILESLESEHAFYLNGTLITPESTSAARYAQLFENLAQEVPF